MINTDFAQVNAVLEVYTFRQNVNRNQNSNYWLSGKLWEPNIHCITIVAFRIKTLKPIPANQPR